MLNVRYYFREYRKGGLSIEGIFNVVKACNKNKVVVAEYHLNPSISRTANILTARRESGGINHITGDVYFLAIGFKSKKNIVTIHDLGHYEYLACNKLKQFIYRYIWLYIPFKRAAIITVVSEFTRQKLVQYFPFAKDKVRLVPNPVKPIFRFVSKANLNSRPRILQLGTGKHKNLMGLIKAAIGLNVHLDIVADIEDDALILLQENNISYTKYDRLTDDEMYDLYKGIDILFFVSFYEGFGMPIIEAQAIGRPVITSNMGAMKEVAGSTAILVDPNSPKEIAGAVTRLVSDSNLYNEMVRRGVENAARYEANVIAEQYYNIYKELAEQK